MTMMAPQYICCLYLATAGQQGNNLGSDEEEIVLLIYIIIDVSKNQVVGARQYLVKPSVADVNENILSEQVQTSSLLTEEMVKSAGKPLATVLYEFDRYVQQTLNIDINDSTNFRFVTDGQLPLRQCLHPECFSKCIELNNYYTLFFDLRKELFKYLSAHNKLNNLTITTTSTIENGVSTTTATSINNSMNNDSAIIATNNALNVLTNNNNNNLVTNTAANNNSLLQIATNGITEHVNIPVPTNIGEMLDLLGLTKDIENEFYIKEAKDMANIVQNLLANGHKFENPETINLVLEPGICFKSDKIEKNCVVRARGLPWQSSDQDIAKFFIGLNIAKGGVALCLSPQGRRNGEALIRFCSQEHRDLALKRHKHHMNKRYIEVYEGNGDDFINVAGGSSSEAQAFLSKGAAVIIRMRGLPYDCTAQQVLDFFSSGDQPCYALDGVDGVLFVKKSDGRSTGDAFVLFSDESDASKALAKHRELIGSRYIELFRSTTAEVQQVLNRSMMDPKATPATNNINPLPNITHTLTQLHLPPTAQLPSFPQRIITSGTRKDCIRLRGLPYEAQVEHILEFLGECAKNIVFQGVHMVYSSQGLPSGEAFIQMDSEKNAGLAAQSKHHRYMYFGKKQRYIEVFQCSGEDMHLVLTGGIPIPTSPIKYHEAYTTSLSPISPGILPAPHHTNAGVVVPPSNALVQQPPPPPPPTINTTVAQIQQNLVTPNPALTWENPALYAQQQAQMIAQQQLLFKQHVASAQIAAMQQAAAAQAAANAQQQTELIYINQFSNQSIPGMVPLQRHMLPHGYFPQQTLYQNQGLLPGGFPLSPPQMHPQTPFFYIPNQAATQAGQRLPPPPQFAQTQQSLVGIKNTQILPPVSQAQAVQSVQQQSQGSILPHPQFMYPSSYIQSAAATAKPGKRTYGDAFTPTTQTTTTESSGTAAKRVANYTNNVYSAAATAAATPNNTYTQYY